MNDIVNRCAADDRSLIARAWSWLGFGVPALPSMDDLDGAPGMAAGHFGTTLYVKLDWRDRLRVLVSGRIGIELAYKTDAQVTRAITRIDSRALPPGFDVTQVPPHATGTSHG